MGGHPLDGWDVLDKAREMAERGEEFAMATVVWREGPSSGQQGSRAVITRDGELFGWIGGACAEPVVIREALSAIRDHETRLLLLGTPEQFGGAVPDGMLVVPIACQSEGALEVFIEPATPTPVLTIVGRSPMVTTLGDLANSLGWRATVVDTADFADVELDARSIVIVATQGHGDEETVERAVQADAVYVGLVASRKRAQSVLGFLLDRGAPAGRIERVHSPVGLDLGHTSHREIAVAILAELVRERAAGRLQPERGAAAPTTRVDTQAVDPVCAMTVRTGQNALVHDGVSYSFCSIGCRDAFAADPDSFVGAGHLTQEA
jgi:xanthine dehydrogenase accessory factor